jgi:thimet oligopeptidase
MQRTICLVAAIFLLLALTVGCSSLNTRVKKESELMTSYKEHPDMQGDNVSSNCKYHLKEAAQLRKQLLDSKNEPFLTVLNRYNDLLVHTDAAMSQASLLSQVHPKDSVRKDAEKCEQEVSSFATDLSLDKELYAVLKKGEKETLDEEAKRLLEHTLRDFRRAGVDKDDDTRKKI